MLRGDPRKAPLLPRQTAATANLRDSAGVCDGGEVQAPVFMCLQHNLAVPRELAPALHQPNTAKRRYEKVSNVIRLLLNLARFRVSSLLLRLPQAVEQDHHMIDLHRVGGCHLLVIILRPTAINVMQVLAIEHQPCCSMW